MKTNFESIIVAFIHNPGRYYHTMNQLLQDDENYSICLQFLNNNLIDPSCLEIRNILRVMGVRALNDSEFCNQDLNEMMQVLGQCSVNGPYAWMIWDLAGKILSLVNDKGDIFLPENFVYSMPEYFPEGMNTQISLNTDFMQLLSRSCHKKSREIIAYLYNLQTFSYGNYYAYQGQYQVLHTVQHQSIYHAEYHRNAFFSAQQAQTDSQLVEIPAALKELKENIDRKYQSATERYQFISNHLNGYRKKQTHIDTPCDLIRLKKYISEPGHVLIFLKILPPSPHGFRIHLCRRLFQQEYITNQIWTRATPSDNTQLIQFLEQENLISPRVNNGMTKLLHIIQEIQEKSSNTMELG